jgi:hypothetical protein
VAVSAVGCTHRPTLRISTDGLSYIGHTSESGAVRRHGDCAMRSSEFTRWAAVGKCSIRRASAHRPVRRPDVDDRWPNYLGVSGNMNTRHTATMSGRVVPLVRSVRPIRTVTIHEDLIAWFRDYDEDTARRCRRLRKTGWLCPAANPEVKSVL